MNHQAPNFTAPNFTAPNTAMQTDTISIVLVDDEHRFRLGLRSLLGRCSISNAQALQVVGEAANVGQALELIEAQNPQLVLLDLELPAGSGVEIMVRLREQHYQGKVLVLSAHEDDPSVFKAMQAGAVGYVFKETVSEELGDAIQTVMTGQVYLSPVVATCFFRRFQHLNQNRLQVCQDVELTEREQEVLYWLVQGESNSAIASHLYVTVATVKAHLTSIFEKLRVHNRTQAIVRAIRLGLVQA